MAKKRPPGWEKKQEKKRVEKYGPDAAPGFTMLTGQAAQDGLTALLERMEKNPENFIAWDSDLEELV